MQGNRNHGYLRSFSSLFWLHAPSEGRTSGFTLCISRSRRHTGKGFEGESVLRGYSLPNYSPLSEDGFLVDIIVRYT